jgi:hypothetical protein
VKDFAAAAGRLRALSTGAKLLYSAFTLSALLGLVISWQLYGAVVGEAGAPAYYAGAPVPERAPPSAPTAGTTATPLDDGPEINLGEEVKPRVITEQISDRKLLEVTHFHLFSIPVYVLILAHLWLLAKIPPWLQASGVVASVITSALHVAAPWIVRGRPGASALMPISGAAMLITLSVIALVPTIDMWLPRRGRRVDDA